MNLEFIKCFSECVFSYTLLDELLKLLCKFLCTFSPQRFVDETFPFEFYVLRSYYVIVCMMDHLTATLFSYKETIWKTNGMLMFVVNISCQYFKNFVHSGHR